MHICCCLQREQKRGAAQMEPKSLLICQLFLTVPFYNFHILILIPILQFPHSHSHSHSTFPHYHSHSTFPHSHSHSTFPHSHSHSHSTFPQRPILQWKSSIISIAHCLIGNLDFWWFLVVSGVSTEYSLSF